ncbi:DNA (cytosine-5)-methyltransferase 1 [Sinosporangium album]|uniref:DNA (cytosine-5-)-methyltransferase n=1 Tax=Sinosporangium album TaxID=504805 RepID=A0A1G8K6B7_9ACTN|nr:DNA (cytosine-5-)-methyltransferase [Sinosporangium album]SDI38350.1 DNA (cytosine-5)-methyltransferase 1 [Sinosporangium album]
MPEQGREYTSVEICAGAGGQALGLHNAGFQHRALIEFDRHACDTLRANLGKLGGQENCQVHELDLKNFTKKAEPKEKQFNIASLGFKPGQITLLAGGVPCPPFSLAGKQLGRDDDRDLFPVMLDMVEALQPRAVMIENVRGLLEPSHRFAEYREEIRRILRRLGYVPSEWTLVEARNFGVPQLRPRAILIAICEKDAPYFPKKLPLGDSEAVVTVADALKKSMRQRVRALGDEGEKIYRRWLEKAERGSVAPTLVGGSKKHGGADLGPTRAKKAWELLGIDAHGVADEPLKDKERDLLSERGIKLTVSQAAIIQGFPEDWKFAGKKTAAYRQVGNAFPPPVAETMGKAIIEALRRADAGEALSPIDKELFEAANTPIKLFECSDLDGESSGNRKPSDATSEAVELDRTPASVH